MGGDLVWVKGSPAPCIDPFDRGFLLGDGVFDTLVAFRGIPFAGESHLERLSGHAAAIGIPLDIASVRSGWAEILSRAEAEHVIVRTTVTRGRTERGLWPPRPPEPTIVVSGAPWHRRLLGRDVVLIVSSIQRNTGSPASRLKSLGYLDHILAAREAAAGGADDALFLTQSGRVACTTMANIFAVSGSDLITPPSADGVLAGIVRALVLAAASSVGLRPAERSLEVADLLHADVVFLTNSVRFLGRVRAIAGQALATRADEALRALRGAIFTQVREECGFEPSAEE